MKLGLWLPIVSTHPGSGQGGWQTKGTGEDLVAISQAAEMLGYDCLCAPEHIGVGIGRPQGTVYWDPVSTLGLLAGGTTTVRLAVLVAVLAYHHPLELAKRYGTLQRLAGDRVVLGVGAGGTREEFELLGVPFQERGARADESIRAIRAAMGTTTPEFAGSFHRYDGIVVEPSLAAGTPIWVGGGSRAAMRRALRLGDGWAPTGLNVGALASRLEEARPELLARPGFEVVYLPMADEVLDPAREPGRSTDVLAAVAGTGVTTFLPRIVSRSRTHYIEQLTSLSELRGA